LNAYNGLSVAYSFLFTLTVLNLSVLWLKIFSGVTSSHSRYRRFIFRYKVIRITF